jgi:hypothetical protein
MVGIAIEDPIELLIKCGERGLVLLPGVCSSVDDRPPIGGEECFAVIIPNCHIYTDRTSLLALVDEIGDIKRRPLKLVTPRPAREGWDDRQVFDYETSPNERAVVQALALRAGSTWAAVILDGSEPTVDKRSAPIGLIFESLRPKGYQRESFAGRKPQPLDAPHIAQLKGFVETSMQQLGIPGASMALIDGSKVVYEGGFGVRELGKPERVDENTLFMAASNTKGMTTLLLSELVDEKKLRWDQPVIDVYPSFKLGDAGTTKKVLVKNLICACTGLPRQDLEWIFEFKNATPESTLALLGTMQPTSKFGEVSQGSPSQDEQHPFPPSSLQQPIGHS